MAGTGLLNAALAELAATLGTITGLPVARDPRNLTPGCVLISAPSGTAFNYNVADIDVPVLIISSGPGNQDALDQLLTILSQLLAKNIGLTIFRPTSVAIGGTDAPAYEVTVRMSAKTS